MSAPDKSAWSTASSSAFVAALSNDIDTESPEREGRDLLGEDIG